MLSERRSRVLQALIDEYVASAIPVGSRTLVERYDLGCSPATVRNELAILEETGYVVQPHVSAGRVPTDCGYRTFVDALLAETPVDVAMSEVSTTRVTGAGEVDDLMRATSAALTQLTKCLAVVLAPRVTTARVERVSVVPMAGHRALLVVVTEAGQVVNRLLELNESSDSESLRDHLERVEGVVNAACYGRRAAEVRLDRATIEDTDAEAPLVPRILDEIANVLDEADRARLYHVGVPALLAHPEFHESERLRPLVEFLEDGIALLDALSDALNERDLTVRIGRENQRSELGNVSIVATHYSAGASDGVVGVIGPTRMDYRRAMAAVRTVSFGLSDALS